MGFGDNESQTVPAYRTQHFRSNRAGRLLSKQSTPLPADLLGASLKRPFFGAGLKSKSSNAARSPCDSDSNRQKSALMARIGLYKIEHSINRNALREFSRLAAVFMLVTKGLSGKLKGTK